MTREQRLRLKSLRDELLRLWLARNFDSKGYERILAELRAVLTDTQPEEPEDDDVWLDPAIFED